jgi:hypothetical protein
LRKNIRASQKVDNKNHRILQGGW